MYVVGKAGRQHWQHVYTAVTRGRCRVYVIAEESHLRGAIMRSSAPRKTRLKHFLQNELSRSCVPPADVGSPSRSSGECRGPSTQPSGSPFPPVTTSNVTTDVPGKGSEASAAEDQMFAYPGEWTSAFSVEVDPEEDPAELRGSKRACGLSDAESPSKMRMVGVLSFLKFFKLSSSFKCRSLRCAHPWLCFSVASPCAEALKNKVFSPLSAVLCSVPVWF